MVQRRKATLILSMFLTAGGLAPGCGAGISSVARSPAAQSPVIQFSTNYQNLSRGAGTVSITLNSNVTPVNSVTTNYTVSGTGTNGVDFTLSNGSMTIAAGSTSTTLAVPIIPNFTVGAAPKTFILTLSSPTLGSLGTNSTYTGKIWDNNAPVDHGATGDTLALLYNLRTRMGSGIMFGHQHDTTEGVGPGSFGTRSSAVGSGFSDIYALTGDYPALFGWDFWNFVQSENSDPVPFSAIGPKAAEAYGWGGVITMSWHAFNPSTTCTGTGSNLCNAWDITGSACSAIKPGGSRNAYWHSQLDNIATWANSLYGADGNLVPVIFRMFHESDGSWFWWGTTSATPCAVADLQSIWIDTLTYLRDTKGVHNFLYVYAPNQSGNTMSSSTYLTNYPGDAYVDILGYDDYCHPNNSCGGIANMVTDLAMVVTQAIGKTKVAALTEIGFGNGVSATTASPIPSNYWTTYYLSPQLKADPNASKIAYAHVWRNADYSTNGYWVPYPAYTFSGVPYLEEQSATNFMTMKADPYSLFLSDIPNKTMYR